MLLRVSPVRGVRWFGIRGKLSPRFIGLYEIEKRIGEVAYKLILPPEVGEVHNVFHVSQLRKFVADPKKVIAANEIYLEPGMEYKEMPIRILDKQTRQHRQKEVKMVKVLWSRHGQEDATWETVDSMKSRYPDLRLDLDD